MINNTNKNPYKNEKDMADSTTQLYHINLFILCNYLKKKNLFSLAFHAEMNTGIARITKDT